MQKQFWSRYTNQLLQDSESPLFGANVTDEFLYRLYAATKLLEQMDGEDSVESRSRVVGDQMQDAVDSNLKREQSSFMPRR